MNDELEAALGELGKAFERLEARVARPAVLEALSRALRREAHALLRRPDLLWQQLYNRLRWQARAAGLVHAERTRALHRLLEAELARTARTGRRRG
jgi:hypothetical protein